MALCGGRIKEMDNRNGTAWLADCAKLVRESTFKRLRRVAPPDRLWNPSPGTLTFADTLAHLVDADRWLLAHLDGGRPGDVRIAPHDADRIDWDAAVAELKSLGLERARRFSQFTEQDLTTIAFDDVRPDGRALLWQLVLRRNLDHEIHHRGELQLMLKLRYGGEP